MNTLKKIIYVSFCIGLLYSCTKDDMEIQKNNDLTWEIDKSIINDDVRTSIGYDPRNTYLSLEKLEVDFEVNTFGELIFSEEETKQIKVVLNKPYSENIEVSLEYVPELFDKVKNKHIGYKLGSEDLLQIVEKEKVITSGETFVAFELRGNFTDTEKVILPYQLKIKSGNDVKMFDQSDLLVVKVTLKSMVNSHTFAIDVTKSSEKMKQMYDETYNSLLNGAYPYRLKSVSIGGTGIGFNGLYVNKYAYEAYYNCKLQIEGNSLNFSNGKGGLYWQYFGYEPFVNMIVNNAPYNIEKTESSDIKLVSRENPEVWFVIKK